MFRRLVVFMNKVDMVDDPELIELVEMEVRELSVVLSVSRATTFRSIKGSALWRWRARRPSLAMMRC